MPLPLPNLDTRRWDDLVAEGRALIPRYAPGWTDHNIHDPGVTLIELFAWVIEQELYRANRISARSRRKFLGLVGFPPRPPRPAQTCLTFTLAPGETTLALPAGLVLVAQGPSGAPLHLQTLADLTLTGAALQAVQVFDGAALADQTLAWREGRPFAAWGGNPQPDTAGGPALYLGFGSAAPLPAGQPLCLWLELAGASAGQDERARLIAEAQAAEGDCQPWRPTADCGAPPDPPPPAPAADPLPPHHSVRAVWEYFDGADWRALDPADVGDETRGLSLSGPVRLTLPAAPAALALGERSEKLAYLRCRMAAGRPDAAPLLRLVALNAVAAAQTLPQPDPQRWTIAKGVAPPAGKAPVVGQAGTLTLSLAGAMIGALAFEAGGPAPEVLVLDYQPASAAAFGSLEVAPVRSANGLPGQTIELPAAVARGQIELVSLEGGGERPWRLRPDLDASGRTDADFTLDAAAGRVGFGDGERGRMAEPGTAILARYQATRGAAGNAPAGLSWRLSGAADARNRRLLGAPPAEIEQRLARIANPLPAGGGADAEDLEGAFGRAAAALFAHERLLDLAASQARTTLDQIERAAVLELPAPERASTLLDIERLALAVPGARVARARAWAGIDPAYPCLNAAGTVTLVIVPELPAGRPEPTPGLLQIVRRFLERRRVVGTRLLVVGPAYVEVRVTATVRARPGAASERVRADLLAALAALLDPLAGGSDGRGWPFGRDVYRSEVLQTLDGVPGVDHVLALELSADSGEAQCGNLCVGPIQLTVSGQHSITVVEPQGSP
jgi:predicted phage baseplate assembly protein